MSSSSGVITMVARCADSVFYNGNIITFSPVKKSAHAIAVEAGRIVAVGSDSEVRSSAPRGCVKYDLGGRCVLPGFIDCHTHFIQMGVDSLSVDLSGTTTLEEALSLMRAAAEKTPDDDWVVGTCWGESKWTNGRFISRSDLDKCCPRHPAVAHRICGHLSSVNSLAIKSLGLDSKTPGVESDASGHLTGVLKESAVSLARSATAPTPSRQTKGLMNAIKKAHSLGVTSIHDNADSMDLETYLRAERANSLKVRVRVNIPSQNLDSMLRLGLSSGLGSDWLRIGGLKIFCDGALGARTAALSEPFADDPGNKGMFVHERRSLDEMASRANEHDVQLVIHAIGDMGIDTTISALESALASSPRRDHRHRIEHLELPTREHIKRISKLKIVASMQPNFVGEWGGVNGMYVDRLGKERAMTNNPFNEILKAGVRLAFGSDCMPFSPVYGIYSAVTAPFETQKISAEQAVAAYTRDAAFAGFDERIKGTLEEGKLADFIVVSSSPFGHPAELKSIRVLKTVVGGEVVHERARSSRTVERESR